MVVDKLEIVNQSLGAVRNELATILNLKKENEYKFV
jgi:aspartyl-tRNA synthetase